ncbi:MAG: TlpA family protein disulfide reductase [Candidatus Symbiothrix sp.]|jgi:thiol-disulfide isomerase/thioredoxin|nr:TlpA family protein disulfide reductase [Candidatus Symbiothrix sp.]
MKPKYFSGARRRSFANIAVAALCMLIVFACKEKRPAVIETPVFDVWSTSTLEIEKIEMTDSATIFHIHTFFYPGAEIMISPETFIRESGMNEKLTIVKAEGIELGEELTIPESGETAFKLYFPPLKPEITKIDFIECESEGCFNIWGIHLTPNAKVKVAPVMAQKECTQPVPAFEYSLKPAKLSGKYLGYSKAMNKEVAVDYPSLSGESQTVKASVADDGSFGLEVPVGYPGLYSSSLGFIFLTPGQEVKWNIDLVRQTREESRLRKDKEPVDSLYETTEGDGFFISKADMHKIDRPISGPEDPEALLSEVFVRKFNGQTVYMPYFPLVIDLMKPLYLSGGKDKSVKEQFATLKEKIKPALDDTDPVYDYILASLYSRRIQESQFYTDADKEEIKAAFAGNSAYSEALIAENDKVKALTEENTALIKQVPDVAEDKVFEEILRQYRGKVVLVDFWATWCGPCKKAFKTMAPLKESWKDKNIVFVYLTGETSPLTIWNKMIPDIHGEHYRVSDNQWHYWSKSLKMEGVPTYMIYDKNGRQVQRYTGYPGNETMKKVIEEL